MNRKKSCLVSMTGFGRGEASGSHAVVNAEARSYNARYLEPDVKINVSLPQLQLRLERMVRSRFRRGRIYLNVEILPHGPGFWSVHVDPSLAAALGRALDTLSRESGSNEKPGLSHLIKFRDLVDYRPQHGIWMKRTWKTVQKAVQEALDDLALMREREAVALEKDLRSRAMVIRRCLRDVERAMPRIRKRHETRLRKNLQIFDVKQSDPVARKFERVLCAEKFDVAEECTRLASHLEQFDHLLAGSHGEGRKFDFLFQEMFREANTIASKAQDASVQHVVVDIKVAIERMREQIQNVE